MSVSLHLGEIWQVSRKPQAGIHDEGALEVYSALAVADGKVVALGDTQSLKQQFPQAIVVDHKDALILPGFIDTHLHFPQMDIIGSFANGLLDWLKTHTFPHEARFCDKAICEAAANRFFTELLANGITLSAIYASSHAQSADSLFAEAARRGVRAVIGKVSMDRDAIPELLVPISEDIAANQNLIQKWHGYEDRLWVALTPRFALSCSEALMAALGELKRLHPTVYIQTHYAETLEEIAAVHKQFPRDSHYLNVYDRFGLLGPQTILGHVIHAGPAEVERIVATASKVAHCPTSNLFLGSGLFPWRELNTAGATISLASDVGGGTSFSMFQTMNEAYKVQALQGCMISPIELLYLATQGGADVLGVGDRLGSLAPGKYADFQVLDWRQHRLLRVRFNENTSAFARLSAIMMLGDDRLTSAVYINGRRVYQAKTGAA